MSDRKDDRWFRDKDGKAHADRRRAPRFTPEESAKYRHMSALGAFILLGIGFLVTILLLNSALDNVDNLTKNNAKLLKDTTNGRIESTTQLCYQENGQNRVLRNLIVGGTFAVRRNGKVVSTAPKAIEDFYKSVGFTPEVRLRRAEDQAKELKLVPDCEGAAKLSVIRGDADAPFPLAKVERERAQRIAAQSAGGTPSVPRGP